MQVGFYFDQERCIGCHTCSVACKDKNNVPAGSAHWRQVRLLERGKYPNVRLLRLSLACNHCADPACVAACPAGAIEKREADGIVVVNRERCLGGDICGRFCLEACPYDAPQFGEESNPKMQKCDFCLDQLQAGEQPACAAACPMLALEAGPLEELEREHDTALSAEGVPDPAETRPSLRFRRAATRVRTAPVPAR
ncbi:MAG: 4Fe-4S dicluster domain-containing protein [Chloroflexi bacterium]|nr:4Fe-4S dicluster domain-containing protein [Chloroflexota bacterium]